MKARVVNIQRFSLHDGPGIRTLVFFKGCPLKCQWCANPECISAGPEIGFSKVLCDKCGECLSACPEKALSLAPDGNPLVDRSRCNACGRCVPACTRDALSVYGKDIPIEELFEELKRDGIFYSGSGGGVTFSGGEPLVYSDQVMELFKLCKKAGISTAVETCGYCDTETFQKVLRLTDFVLYDLKALDDLTHQKLTGKSNALILANARTLVHSGVELQFRLPLVPGLNDIPENIKATSEFILSLGKKSIELMPYHRLGVGKYEALAKDYTLADLPGSSHEQVETARLRFEETGLKCLVSR
ncbi:MAG: glycyl-radical enzyme activating protein [Dehalococcoidia bacterium]|nr:glycyl-radical enzyme activating protein [Dehalococcoidia bacterium]